jgi:hypothetical protein
MEIDGVFARRQLELAKLDPCDETGDRAIVARDVLLSPGVFKVTALHDPLSMRQVGCEATGFNRAQKT